MLNLSATNGSFKIGKNRFAVGSIAQLEVNANTIKIEIPTANKNFCLAYDQFSIDGVAVGSMAQLEAWFEAHAYIKSCCEDVPEPARYTLTFVSVPAGAVIRVNGVIGNTFNGTTGQTCTVTAQLAGYNNFSQSFTVGTSNANQNLVLTATPVTHRYYFGEAGAIYTATPATIEQEIWDKNIKPNMQALNHSALQNNYAAVAVNRALRWWMVLIPAPLGNVATLNTYRWQTFDELTSQFVNYDIAPLTGTVTLDGILYSYSAIRPNDAVQIRFIKN